MEHKGSVLRWRLTLSESIALAVACVGVTLWMSARFQTKEDAAKLELRVSAMESNMNQIAVDVSYIRGRLEPKK